MTGWQDFYAREDHNWWWVGDHFSAVVVTVDVCTALLLPDGGALYEGDGRGAHIFVGMAYSRVTIDFQNQRRR